MEQHRFPTYLSRPFQILWLEADELVFAVIFYLLALMFGRVFIPFIVLGPYIYVAIKKRHPRGFLKHTFYMIGLAKLKGYPIYYEKEFQE